MITYLAGTRLLSSHQIWALYLLKEDKPENATDLMTALNEYGFDKTLHNVCAMLRQLRENGWVDEDCLELTTEGVKVLMDNLRIFHKLAESIHATYATHRPDSQ